MRHAYLFAALVVAAPCNDWRPNPVRGAAASQSLMPSILAVHLTPETASLGFGATQVFVATGDRSDGSTAPVSVTWSATGGTISTIGLYTAGTVPGTYRVIAVQQPGPLADTAIVILHADQSSTDDVLHVLGVPAGQPVWLLQDSDAGGGCASDLVTRLPSLEASLPNLGLACATELSVFAEGRSPTLLMTPPWSAAIDDINITMGSPLVVKLNIVAVGNATARATALLDIDADIATANSLFDKNSVGIQLAAAAQREVDDAAPAAARIGGGCSHADQAAVSTEVYDATQLNILAVPDAGWEYGPGGGGGWNCRLEGHPEIIYIRRTHFVTVLTHEVGHAFSLAHTVIGGTNFGWPGTNLMGSSFVDANTWKLLDRFSVGQVYRANFNKCSWIYNTGIVPDPDQPWNTCTWNGTPGVRTNPTNPKVCQDGSAPGNSTVNWPCPRLQLDWPTP